MRAIQSHDILGLNEAIMILINGQKCLIDRREVIWDLVADLAIEIVDSLFDLFFELGLLGLGLDFSVLSV